ncbi:MAG: hypothetical protein KF912_13935 [Phycisphaeraceae bacterium]|nr:hypothetical protein [Phycisphaeraceae bacterium]
MVAHAAATLDDSSLGGSALGGQSGGSAPPRATRPTASAPPPSAPPSLCPSDPSPSPSAPSASSSSSSPPRHSAALRVESSSSDDSLIPAHLHSPILSALCHPGSSLCSVARDFRIAVDILAMWLTEPDTREKMLAIEKGGCAHTRMAASVTLASTVGVLQTIIDDYTQARAHARQLRAQHEHLAPGASRYDPLPPSHLNAHPARSFLPGEAILGDTSLQAQRIELRRADGARRACHHLYRLSRILPIDDSKLALAACLKPDANSRVACLHEVQACSEDLSTSAPTDFPHGCSVGGAAMPPDQLNSSLSPSSPDRSTLRHSAPSETSAFSSPRDVASRGSSPGRRAAGYHDLLHGSSIKPDANSASSLKADADSVACLHEVQACSDELPPKTSPIEPHGCAVGGAAMPPDQPTTSDPPSAPFPSPSAPPPSPPAPVPRPHHAA